MKDKIQNLQKRIIAFVLAFFMILTPMSNVFAIKIPWSFLFPKARIKGLNMGTIKQNNELNIIDSSVKTDKDGKKYIEWTYTCKVEKEKNPTVAKEEPEDPTLDRYFITTKDSGLGEISIISVTKDGNSYKTPEVSGTGSYNNFVSKKEHIDLKGNDKFGTYVYKIKTPIVEHRDYYVLYVNSVLNGKFKKGRTVNVGGVKRKLQKDEEVSVSLSQRGYVRREEFLNFDVDRRNKMDIETSMDDYKVTYGEYLDENRIIWHSSYINTDSFTANVEMDLTPDDSQTLQNLKVYYLKPGKDGYEVDEKRTKIFENTAKVEVNDLPSGWILKLELLCDVKKENGKAYTDHFLKNIPSARLESFYAKAHIEKKWGENTNEDEKVDTNFTVKGGEYDMTLNIKKNQSESTKFEFVPKFKKTKENSSDWERINYEVNEIVPKGFKLKYKAENKHDLKYVFKNDKEREENPGSGSGKNEECSAYGVISLEKVDINQYWYEHHDDYAKNKKVSWYGYGGALKGKLKVPKNAGVGQSITLKLPDEIRYERGVSDKPVIGFAKGNGTAATEIGKIYHEKGNVLRFVFNDKAKADDGKDYEINFEIGQGVGVSEGLVKVNGQNIDKNTTFNKYPVGIEPNFNKFFDEKNQKEKKALTKKLPFKTEYHNFNGSSSCETKTIEVETTVHYEDAEIAKDVSHLNKYVVEEGDDYIIWESVYNASGDRIKITDTDFYDFLGITNTLYHGNETSSLPQDVELFVSDHGTVSGSYVKGTEKQIYPRGGNAEVTGFTNNEKVPMSNLKKVYQLSYKVRNLNNQTLIARVKTKKLAPLIDGDINDPKVKKYYYNHIQSQQSSHDRDRYIKTIRYAPKRGRTGTISQGIYEFSLQKTEYIKDENESKKEVALKNNPCEFMANRVDGTQSVKGVSDKDGKVTFKGLKDGEFIVQEISAPTGYTPYKKEFRFKITVDSKVEGEVGKIKTKIEYKKDNGEWTLFDEKNIPTIPNNSNPGLKIRKIDAVTKRPLKGAKFSLSKSDLGDGKTYNQTVDIDGVSEFVFESLIPGRYTLSETNAPEGYEKADDILLDVDEVNGQIIVSHRTWAEDPSPKELKKEAGYYVFKVPNRKKSKVVIKKFDIYGNLLLSSDAKFDLYAEDTNKGQNEVGGFDFSFKKENTDERYKKKEYTFEDGSKMYARLANNVFVTKASNNYAEEWANTPTQTLGTGEIIYENLPDGRYFVMEQTPPNGYEKLSHPIPFVIENGVLKGNFYGHLPIVNIKEKGEFSIEKTNQTGKKLENVKFTLYKKNEDGEKTENGKIEKTTDSEGHVTFSDLDKGQYILEETTPPEGIEAEGPFDVFVDEDKKVAVVDQEGKNIIHLKILKKGEFQKKPVAEIENSKKYNLVLRKRDKIEVETFMKQKGEDPEFNKKLEAWQKKYDEAVNYIDSFIQAGVYDSSKKQELIDDWVKDNPKPVSKSSVNDANEFDSKIEKEKDKNFTLLKAKFELLNKDGVSFSPPKIGETTEEKGGVLKFLKLKPGDYILREIESPNEYLGLKEDFSFTLTEDGKIVTTKDVDEVITNIPPSNGGKDLNFVVKNKKVKYKIKIVKVDYDTEEIINNSTKARFKICDENKQQIKSQVANLDNGYFEFKNDDNLGFKPGIYTIIEEVAPSGKDGKFYSKLDPIKIKLKSDGSIEVLEGAKDFVISNGVTEDKEKKTDGTIEIKIKNAFTKDLKISKRIFGKQSDASKIKDKKVSFKLTRDSDNKEILKEDQDTNKDIEFKNLIYGNYTLEELKSPVGFVKEDKTYKVIVDDEGANIYKDEDEKDITDMSLIKSNHFNHPRSTNPESYALDRDENTYAVFEHFLNSSNDLPKDAWIGVDLKDVKLVTSFFVNLGHTGNFKDKFDEFSLEYSLDNVNYKTFKVYKESDNVQNVSEQMNVKARYIRFRNLKEKKNTWIGIQDFFIKAKDLKKEENENGAYLIRNVENPNFKIKKVDKRNTEIENLKNLEFELRKVPINTYETENLDEFSGDFVCKVFLENSKTIFKDKNKNSILENKLPFSEYGKYILVEKNAPEGYKKLSKVILLDFSKDEKSKKPKLTVIGGISNVLSNIKQENDTLILSVTNFKDSDGEFMISKRIKGLENESSLKLEGATFKLTKDDDTSFKEVIKKMNKSEPILFDGLKNGMYTLEELISPLGYVKDKALKVLVDSAVVKIYDLTKDSKENLKALNLSEKNLIMSDQLKVSNMNVGSLRTVDKIFDKDDDTVAQWVLNGSKINKDTFVGVDLKGYFEVEKIRFLQDPTGKGGNDKFDELSLEYSLDGKNYTQIKEYKNSPTEIKEENLKIKARFIRIRNLKEATGRWFMLNTIEIHAKDLAFKTLENTNSIDLSDEKNLVKIGNIQNPYLNLEKIDENGKLITKNSENFTAKFKLYKVLDENSLNFTNETNFKDTDKFNFVDEFTLKEGKLETTQKANSLGKYVLVETQAPEGYKKTDPIVLELVETRQKHNESLKKHTTAWKVLSDTNTYKKEDGYPKFEGQKDFQKINVDYSKLQENKITLKVKNEKNKATKLKLKKGIKILGSGGKEATFKENRKERVTFKLTKDNDTSFKEVIKEDSVAKNIEFENLTPGVYTLEELKAPVGYIRKKTPYKVFVDENLNIAVTEKIDEDKKLKLDESNFIKSDRFKDRPLQEGSISNIFDGNKDTHVQINTDQSTIKAGDFVGVDLKALYHVKDIKFLQGPLESNTIAGNDAFDKMIIEYSFDNKTWYKASNEFVNKNKDKLTNSKKGRPNSINDIEKTNQNIVARYIRFRNTEDATGRWFILREIEITASKVGDEKKEGRITYFKNFTGFIEAEKENSLPINIPNLENPFLELQKLDESGNIITKNNKNSDYNAKFVLYKVSDNKTSLTDDELKNLTKENGFIKKDEFILKNGELVPNKNFKNEYDVAQKIENQKIDTLGRYLLVEEQAPDGYEKMKPVFLDLVEGKKEIWEGIGLYVVATAWKFVDDGMTSDEDNIYEFTGSKEKDNIIIDYSNLANKKEYNYVNKSILSIKVKNKKVKGKFNLSKRIKGIEDLDLLKDENLKAKFTLIKDDDKTKVVTKEENLKNVFKFYDLDVGSYTLIEDVAPNGYVKEKDDFKIFVNFKGDVSLYKEIKNENEKTLSNITLSKTISGNVENESFILDGNENTQAIYKPQASTVKEGEYINLSFNGIYKLSSLKLLQDKESPGGNDAFDNLAIEYSLDGVNFKTFKKYENKNKPNKPNTIGTIQEDNLNLIAKEIRFKSLENSSQRWIRINEIVLKGKKIEHLKEITKENQDDSKISLNENLLKIGNIQNPKLEIQKIDFESKKIIEKNNENKDFNAKFKLYKVLDENSLNFTNETNFEDTDKFNFVDEFTLKEGKLETIQKANSLGKYVLVEKEAPDGYKKTDPIVLELVETRQKHNESLKKHTTAWKVLSDTNTYKKEDGYPKFEGQKDFQKINVDYSKLQENKIILKVKNKKDFEKIKIKVVKIDKDNMEKIKGDDNTSSRFFITKENTTDDNKKYNGQIANLKDGEFLFDNKKNNFEQGLYYLVEKRAPKGYNKLSKPIAFYIEKDGNVIIPAKEENGKFVKDEQFVFSKFIEVEQKDKEKTVTIKIKNKMRFFPHVGGIGTLIFFISGFVISFISYIFIKKYKKNNFITK